MYFTFLSVICSMQKVLFILFCSLSLYAESQTQDYFMHDGEQRDFVYYTPSTWDINQELPLLIVLHGLTQTGNGIMDITNFNELAEDNNFIVCYPDGINNSWNANMNVTVSQADDLGFLEELCLYFENDLNSNPLQKYLCGISSGGFMCHKMACESQQCFAAIGTVSGSMSDTVYSNCTPNHLTSLLHIHGTADDVAAYNGSPTTGVSVDETMTFWQEFLSCNATADLQTMPNPNVFDLSHPEKYIYQNCNGGELEHIKVIGGGHQWPGIVTVLGGVGTINMDFYSPQVIWDFLEGKSCPETTVGFNENTIKTKKLLRIMDCLGREVKEQSGIPLLYLYDDGSVERIFVMGE